MTSRTKDLAQAQALSGEIAEPGWLAERIGSPRLRKSVSRATLAVVGHDWVYLEYDPDSGFHRASAYAAREELERAFSEVLGRPVRLRHLVSIASGEASVQ